MFRLRTNTRLKLILLWRSIKWPILSSAVLGVGVVFVLVGYRGLKSRATAVERPAKMDPAGAAVFDEISEAVVNGEYEKAIRQVREKCQEYPDDMLLKKWHTQLTDSLKIDFKFKYLPDRRKQIAARNSFDQITLTLKDPYYLNVSTSDRCYLYLFQLQSSGELAKLFPNPQYVPTPNPVPGGPIRIPDGSEWFYLDDTPGTETIYLVASRWRQESLEELCVQLESEDNIEQERELIGNIIERLEHEYRATETIPGLVSAKYQFNHKESL